MGTGTGDSEASKHLPQAPASEPTVKAEIGDGMGTRDLFQGLPWGQRYHPAVDRREAASLPGKVVESEPSSAVRRGAVHTERAKATHGEAGCRGDTTRRFDGSLGAALKRLLKFKALTGQRLRQEP
jgi:hypothetical protein